MIDLNNFRNRTVPHYFKKDFPDQRFLPFKLFLHTRRVEDALPDLKFFESYYANSKSQKRPGKVSPLRSNRIFKSKEKLYKELFTNGKVDIRTDYQLAIERSKSKSPALNKVEQKISFLMSKGKRLPQKPNHFKSKPYESKT